MHKIFPCAKPGEERLSPPERVSLKSSDMSSISLFRFLTSNEESSLEDDCKTKEFLNNDLLYRENALKISYTIKILTLCHGVASDYNLHLLPIDCFFFTNLLIVYSNISISKTSYELASNILPTLFPNPHSNPL